MASPIFGLYAIIDPRFCGRQSPAQLATALLAGGCRLIQLRVKGDGSDAGIARCDAARALSALKHDYDFHLIINDDVSLARELRADGVHLGATDLPIPEARAMVGPHMLIGYSAHRAEEAVAAERQGADYVAFGAIYPTATKGSGHPVQGLTRLTQVVQVLSVPVVAIGGITRANVGDVWTAGVAAVAMITALSGAPDPRAEAHWFAQRLRGR